MSDGPGGRPPPWTAPADELVALVAAFGPGAEATSDGTADRPISDADVLERLRADIAALLDVPASEVAAAASLTDAAMPAAVAAATIVGHPGALAARLTGRIGTAAALDPGGPYDAQPDEADVAATRTTRTVLAAASDDEATILIDADATDAADAEALLRAFVGAPVGAWPAASLADPMVARERAWASGLARPLADAVVVSKHALMPPGGARLVRSRGPLDRLRTMHDIVTVDRGWQLRQIEPAAPIDDALPFVALTPPSHVMRGIRADRLLGDALASGPETPPARRLVERWWTAARALRVAGPDGRLPYDLRPRDFVIDAAGAWHHTGGRIRHRVAVPAEATLVGGLVDVVTTTLRRRWIDGVDPAATVGELVTRLARHAGSTLAPASWQLWAMIDASASERADAEPVPRASAQDARIARLERRVGDAWWELPLPERVRAAIDLAGARRAHDVAGAHESLRVELLDATRRPGEGLR